MQVMVEEVSFFSYRKYEAYQYRPVASRQRKTNTDKSLKESGARVRTIAEAWPRFQGSASKGENTTWKKGGKAKLRNP